MLKIFIAVTLLSSSLAALVPELGVNVGLGTNSQTSYVYPTSTQYSQRGGITPIVSLKFFMNTETWQFGGLIGYAMPHISYKQTTGNEFKVFLAQPLVPVAILINKKFHLSENNVIYTGVALGVGLSFSRSSDALQGRYAPLNSAVMPLLGAQVGYTYYLGRVGFNAEASLQGLPELTGNANKYGYYVYGATLGIRFRI